MSGPFKLIFKNLQKAYDSDSLIDRELQFHVRSADIDFRRLFVSNKKPLPVAEVTTSSL
jgi:hypothetical protein